MTNRASAFDLTVEPWIPCRGPDGSVRELGIAATLANAHVLAGLSGDLPTQTFALTRLLLAVLHAALEGPQDIDEWRELWEEDRLPVDRIEVYLDRHRSRLDLLHPETPFFQVAGLRTGRGETSELTKLVADVPNGVPVFATRRGPLTLTFAEAARWLVHCQAFDPSGIKSGAVGDDRVKGGKGYPIGVAWSGLLGGVLLEDVTLKKTLLLNLIAADLPELPRDRERDHPAWERPPSTAAEELPGGRTPDGPVDLYTWQSRRIRLVRDGDRVARVLIANGERLTPQNRHRVEPLTGWRRSEPQEKKLGLSLVYMPREHDPDRAIWRGMQSLLPAATESGAAAASSALAPAVLQWLHHLVGARAIEDDHLVRVRTVGMVYGSNSSVVDDVVHDTLPLCALLARQDAGKLAAVVVSCVAAAEAAAKCVGNLVGDLVAAAGGDGAGPRSRAMERFYDRCDAPFRAWLVDIGPATHATDVQETWHRQALSLARSETVDVLRDIPPAAWAGREVRGRTLTAAHAEERFRRDLRAALPFAFPPSIASTEESA